ncbi:hypothetical protein Cni_G16756 [Canna indica]|uniref:Uncharacterized protein n=1 Tax=Canna indica TaxID=4628 RepID=A0AAQ3KFU5_9LILI|nr:hypothetical protein Cni_G16756 [Canna indica]
MDVFGNSVFRSRRCVTSGGGAWGVRGSCVLRVSSPTGTDKMQTTRVIPRAIISQSEKSNSKVSPDFLGQIFDFFRSTSQEESNHRLVSASSGSSVLDLPHDGLGEVTSGSRDEIVIDLWDEISRSSKSSKYSMRSTNDGVLSNTSSIHIIKDKEIEGSPSFGIGA